MYVDKYIGTKIITKAMHIQMTTTVYIEQNQLFNSKMLCKRLPTWV